MPLKRRSPGQRRRRMRRDDELAQVEALYPDQYAELVELRKYNPQAYRKALIKLTRKGKIARGRGFEVPADVLALLELDLDALKEAAAELGFRELAGLVEEEKGGRARPDVLEWLRQRYEAVLDEENRYVP